MTEHVSNFLGYLKDHLRAFFLVELQKKFRKTVSLSAGQITESIPTNFKVTENIVLNNMIRDKKLNINS